MAALKDIHKAFLVAQYAQGRGPTEIGKLFLETFSFPLQISQIAYYNPAYNSGLAPKWQEVFRQFKTDFYTQLDEVPGAHLSVRVSRLWEMAEKRRNKGDLAGAAALYEQIAKDLGGIYEKRTREQPTVPAGTVNTHNALIVASEVVKNLSGEARLAAILGIPLERIRALKEEQTL